MTTVDTPRHDVDPTGPDGGEPKERFFTPGRTFGTVVVVLLAAMWLYLFIFGNSYHPPGWLTDRSFPPVAEKICNRAEAYINRLPAATQSKTAADRADAIDLANARLRVMETELREVVPANSQAKFVNEWLDDWTTFIHDRQTYADNLRKSAKTEFLVTPKAGTALSESLDNFANVNNMVGCVTPHDV